MTAIMSLMIVGLYNKWLSKSHFPILSQIEACVFNCLTLNPQEKVHSTQ